MHHLIAKEAFEAGQHVLTQKPLAISVKAGQMMVDLAQQKGLTLGLFENVRQAPGNRAMHWALEQGIIGDLQLVVMGSIGGLWSPEKIVAETPWRHKKLLGGGGGAIDIGVHVMHMVAYVCGQIQAINGTVRTFEPIRTTRDAQGKVIDTVEANVDDTYLATVHLPHNAIAQMMWSWGMHGESAGIPGAPIYYGSKGGIKGGEAILDDGTRRRVIDWFEAEADAATKEKFFPMGLRDPFAIAQLDWLQAIERGGQPETDGVEGVRDLAAAFAMIESSELGRTVTMDEVLSGEVAGYQQEINDYYGL
jgi:predicted dehydrogenase